ncbi:hypothetical protein EPN42_10650 [bacterium]|nr:MAG: hypothetical protein EPN42_10650 [bacterium]
MIELQIRLRFEKRVGTPLPLADAPLRVCGGGSQSDAATQITSDAFGLPAVRTRVYETSGLAPPSPP